jgi:hypothetical protein
MNILFEYRPQTNQYDTLNQMIIIAKYYLYTQCLKEEDFLFLNILMEKIRIEKEISVGQNKTELKFH